jgi:DNA helicase IV
MRDTVATIQAEQGKIIRLDHLEVLMIEGGPGTGKTVVALHRVILESFLEPAHDHSVAFLRTNSGEALC